MPSRSLRPLLSAWLTTLAVVLPLAWLAERQPAYAGLIRPVLPFAFVPAVWATWKWLRGRSGERRQAERRAHERRED